jgi:RHS repeat-associated protein
MRSNQVTQYEFFNLPNTIGMGNVLRRVEHCLPRLGVVETTTVTDKKIPVDVGNDGTIDWYVADITSATDYYPFGSPMDGRTFSSDKYRFGFNGKENDNEIQGDGNSYDFGARIFDSRLGRWLSLDPLMAKYPDISPYVFCVNNPIIFIDPDGRDIEPVFHKGPNGEDTKLYAKIIIDGGLDGQFVSDLVINANGKTVLMLKATQGGGDLSKMSESAIAFYNELNSMINDNTATAKIDVYYGNPDVNVGCYKMNAIDVGDIMQFNPSGKMYKMVGASRAGKMAHELTEQFKKAKEGIPKGFELNTNSNHEYAIKHSEDKVNCNERKEQRGDNRGPGTVKISYLERDGSTTVVHYCFPSNGVVGIDQPKPILRKK